MNDSARDQFLSRKPQYSSRIVLQPNTSINKDAPKFTYSRGGHSVDPRDNNKMRGTNLRSLDSAGTTSGIEGIQSMITQTSRAATNRPVTSSEMPRPGYLTRTNKELSK